MSWRSRLEDKYTVVCKHCGHESIDLKKRGNQRYLRDAICSNCKKKS